MPASTSTPQAAHCEACGTVVSPFAPDGQCVCCLLELALKSGKANAARQKLEEAGTARRFGDYELIHEIARGGMGVVLEARQMSLNRTVALKLLLEGQFATESAIKRFEFEAEAAANLDHPNIVPIYEVGQQDGWPYLAMKLIRGSNLAQKLAGHPRKASAGCADKARANEKSFSFSEIATLLAKVARAIHFAHLRGTLHRDLKPSNILIDEEGEPHITDFGLAKCVTADGRLTMTGALLGSPFYMAPEQASGKTGSPSVSTDLYSLGVIMFELLTGRLPFEAEAPVATLKLVLETEAPLPRTINAGIPRDLETICLKCLAKDPNRRYESAAALAQDLEHWLAREPILARPASGMERSWKWIVRHPLKASLVAVSALAVFGPLISTFYLYHFVLPLEARSHPIVGFDHNIAGFSLTFETNNVGRATMNFDLVPFENQPRQGYFYFANLPPEALSWSSNLTFQILADIPAVPDEPRSPIVRAGQVFSIEHPRRRDRAYYVHPVGWQGQDILKYDRNARLCLRLLEVTNAP